MDLNECVDNLELMRTWLDNCRDNHTRWCGDHEYFLPTRLLDLEAFEDSEDVRLVTMEQPNIGHSQKEHLLKYVALSHCWGPPSKHPLTTTKATLRERQTRIPFTKLPLTFQDAVKTTRALKRRYLWIDSLCIIQGDEEDWAKEAASMTKVYRCSDFTIAATGSKDSSEGCRTTNDIQSLCQNRFVDIDFISGKSGGATSPQRVRIFEGRLPDLESSPEEPLSRRAWALQEKELSRRFISFTPMGLYWKCFWNPSRFDWVHDGCTATSFRPWEHHKLEFISSNPRECRDFIQPGNEAWFKIVEDYSARSLTNESDRMVALSGIARYMQKVFTDAKYVGGIWSTALPVALLWVPLPTDEPTSESMDQNLGYIAPSWSWASARSRVTMLLLETIRHFADIDFSTPRLGYNIAYDDLKVEEVIVIPKYDDPYGALSYGALVLSGARLVNVEIDPNHLWRMTKDGAYAGDVALDSPRCFDPNDGRKLYCLAIWEDDYVRGLVLREGHSPADGYSRVGIAHVDDVTLFDSIEVRTIKLV